VNPVMALKTEGVRTGFAQQAGHRYWDVGMSWIIPYVDGWILDYRRQAVHFTWCSKEVPTRRERKRKAGVLSPHKYVSRFCRCSGQTLQIRIIVNPPVSKIGHHIEKLEAAASANHAEGGQTRCGNNDRGGQAQ